MYDREHIGELISFISARDGISGKASLAAQVQQHFHLSKDRSVFYGTSFSIRFCQAASVSFSNTVLSFSALLRHDSLPFFVCLVTPSKNYLMLANTTFLRKISHSSQELRCDNIRGSFNGSDIMRSFEGLDNAPENFEVLFASHENFTFEENLERLVEATNHIAPTGKKFLPTKSQTDCIYDSVDRAISFFSSHTCKLLEEDFNGRVKAAAAEIKIASSIENVNLRGRIIESLITSEGKMKKNLMDCLRNRKPLPEIFTADRLGDYERKFDDYLTATDIKTKLLFLSGNPKGYNIDKLLDFLSKEKSVYLVYILAIDEKGHIRTRLCSPYHRQLLSGTRILKHWAGRNSRGVTQYEGRILEEIIFDFDEKIDRNAAQDFLEKCLK